MRSRPVVAGVSILVLVLVVLAVRQRLRNRPASHATKRSATQPVASPQAAAVTAPTPVHGEQQLVTQIIQQGLTPDRAKLLFGMVVGDLPDVSVPEGSRDPADWDGTLAVYYLDAVWDSLTPAQRTAATHLINQPGGGPQSQRSSSAASRQMLRPVTYAPTADVLTADTPAFDYQALAEAANSTLAGFLNRPPVNVIAVADYGPPTGTDYALTTSWVTPQDLVIATCHVKVFDQRFRPLNQTDAAAIVAHEVFHCFQQRQAGSPENVISVHPWITEGEATWAMQIIVPGASAAILGEKWEPYLTNPRMHFAKRAYDAVGVYAHLADIAGDAAVWPKLLPMVTLARNGGPADIAAFDLLTGETQVTYFTDWGSSYFEVDQNTPWEMLNRRPASAAGPAPQPVTVDGQTTEALTPAANYESELFQLTGSADVAIVSLMTGYGRIHDKAFAVDEALDVSAPLGLCLKSGGCKCPDGSPGASLLTKAAAAPVSIGINGGSTTAQVGVAGLSLDKFCKQPDPPTPPGSSPGGGGGGGGGGEGPSSGDGLPEPPEGVARGDTHIVTFDGLHYDFQVVGEYTLVKSTKDDFVVQARMIPARNSQMFSMTQAIAMKLAGHRVTVSIENATEVVRVDAKELFGAALPASLRGAVLCTETMYGSSCQFTWPDGTIVRATQIEPFAMNVAVQPARARLGTLAGLLGDGDSSPANDLIGTRGAHLGTQPSAQDINHSLATAWRVKAGESLFDYLPGQSSRTFADTTFPRSGADAGVVANRDSAEKTCRQEGITDAHLIDDCILDLAATNNFAYASVYSHVQRVTDAKAVLQQTSMRGVLRTLYMDGVISDKSVQPILTFPVKDSDVVWIDSAGCKDADGTIRVYPLWHAPLDTRTTWDSQLDGLPRLEVDSDDPRRVPACRLGRFKVMAGTVALLANPAKDELGAFHIPVHFVRHDRVRSITYGTTVDGEIENPAARDVYFFIGHPGDIVRVSGDGCDIGRMITGIGVPSAYEVQGPLCTGGDFTLRLNPGGVATDTTAHLIVNWEKTAGPAKYHFVFQGAPAR